MLVRNHEVVMNSLILNNKIICINISEETEEEHFNILKRNEKFLKQKMFVENKFVDILLQKKIIDSDECNDLKCTLQRNVEEEAVSALIKVNTLIFSTKKAQNIRKGQALFEGLICLIEFQHTVFAS